ncbi:MAG TPA: DUF4124 domain-containing protein [Burkholderiales bacterium]|nr:DUF4124 domain-containing protein [Burkholderiales bacterium]
MSVAHARTAAWLMAGALGFLAAPTANAQIYKWVDAQGVVNYSNYPPANMRGARVVTEEKVSTVSTSGISAEELRALEERIAARQAQNAADSGAYQPSSYREGRTYYPYSAARGPLEAPTLRTPYGIGNQPIPSQRVFFRDIPNR